LAGPPTISISPPDRDGLRSLSAAEISARVNAGEVSALEVVESHLDAAADAAQQLNVFITLCPERAIDRARQGLSGPLAGVPLLPKDMLDTAGVRTTRGSGVFRDRVPRRTAWAVERLEAAGAIVIGKANQHEFAWGVTSQNPHYGNVVNPVHPDLTPGGSSGGDAAALAARLCALGLATDTGGSIRMPSACCETVGFKPSWGSVDVAGCFPLAPSFDTIGPMARTVRDCALAFSVLVDQPVPEPRLRGLTVGVLELLPEQDRLESLGARLVDCRLPEPDADLSIVMKVESAITHRNLYPRLRDGYGDDVRAKLDDARAISAVDYHEAKLALRRWRRQTQAEIEVDLLVSPTLGIPVPAADAYEPSIRDQLGRNTRPFNYLGWPAIAIGNLQIAGRKDQVLLAAALAWEAAGASR
jgi:aspartyl-tRNA(Asn)/glutamyl-tRNA(Gln) amidotransferase subunit A